MRRLFQLLIVLGLALGLGAGFFLHYRVLLTEKALNHSLKDFFDNSLTLQDIRLSREGRLRLSGLKGTYRSQEGAIPIEAMEIASREPLTELLKGGTVHFDFQGVRPRESLLEGIRGEARVRIFPEWHLELRADILSLELRDLAALSPENLTGSSGTLKGVLTAVTDARADPIFGLVLNVFEPGGSIQARFFDAITPYLPQTQAQTRVKAIASSDRMVAYRNAHLNIGLISPQEMKIFLHILIPEYNLDLNINVQVRVDKNNAFLELAQLMGLAQIKAATP